VRCEILTAVLLK